MAYLPESTQENEKDPGTCSIGTRVYAGRDGVTWLMAIPHATIPDQQHKSQYIVECWNLFFIGLKLRGVECRRRFGYGRDFRAHFPPDFDMTDECPVLQADFPFSDDFLDVISALVQMPQIAMAMQADPKVDPIVPKVFSHLIETSNRAILQYVILKRGITTVRDKEKKPSCITFLVPKAPSTSTLMLGTLTEETLGNICHATPLLLSTSTRVRRPDEYSSGTGLTIRHVEATPHDTPGEFAGYLLEDLPYLIEGTEPSHHPSLSLGQQWMLQVPVRSALVSAQAYLENMAREFS